MKRFNLAKLISVVLLLGACFLGGCGEDERYQKSSVPILTGADRPDQITFTAHINLYSGGRKTTDLLAQKIEQYTKRDSTIATDLNVEFFDSTGARVSTLTADKGYIREKDNFLAVTGSVVVIGEDSVRLETVYLEWDAAHDRVVTDSFVTIIRESDTLYSYGVETDPRLRNTTFKRQVRGQMTDIEKGNNDRK